MTEMDTIVKAVIYGLVTGVGLWFMFNALIDFVLSLADGR